MRTRLPSPSLSLGGLLLVAIGWLMSTDGLRTAAEAAEGTPAPAPPPGPPAFIKQWGGLGREEGQLFMPWGIAVGPDGLVYVAEHMNNRVQVFTPEGEFVRLWGGLRGPTGLAVGPDGLVYVSDSFGYRVRVFTPEGEPVRAWGGPPGGRRPFTPWGIAVAPDGAVYVSDLHAHRVYKFTAEGELLGSWGGLGTAPGEFTGPTGIAVGPDGLIYVVDSLGYRVQAFTPEGEVVRAWGGLCDLYIHPGLGCRDPDGPEGPLEPGDGQFSSPWGIAFDPEGRVYVVDSANKRVQVFTPEGEFLLKWGELGRGPGQFDNPVGIAIDAQGAIYVSEINNNRVQKFAFVDAAAGDEGGGGSAALRQDLPRGGHPPVVLGVELPERIEVNGLAVPGRVRLRDPDGDLVEVRFRVVDGKYDPFWLRVEGLRGRREGEATFTVRCEIAQQVTLLVEAVDAQGLRSAPWGFSFTCGEPPRGTYDLELQTKRPVRRTLGMNVLILKDGVTTLAEGARFPDPTSPVGEPAPVVRRAFENAIVPAITGLWDQCGVGFRLETLAVVRPDRLRLEGGTLDAQLFVRRDGALPEVPIGDYGHGRGRRRALDVLNEALEAVAGARAAQGRPFDARALTVFVTGARLVLRPGDRRHFGGVTTLGGHVSLVRWDALWVLDAEAGEIFPPKRPITAFAHEFGHNFGLEHVPLDEDPLNLMLSVPGRPTAVPPQPTVRLLPWQCEQARPRVEELALN